MGSGEFARDSPRKKISGTGRRKGGSLGMTSLGGKKCGRKTLLETGLWSLLRMDGISAKEKAAATGHKSNLATDNIIIPPPRWRAIQLCIIVLLFTLVGLLAISVWYFNYCSSRLLIPSRLAESLRKEVLDSTVEFLDELFRWNEYGAKSLVEMLERDLLGDGASMESLNKIRAASWSLFKGIPLITSIGVASSDGLTGIYSRGGLLPVDLGLGETGNRPIFLYTKSTEEHGPYYVENVNASTGKALGDPKEYHFVEHIHSKRWFRSALSVPLRSTTSHLEKGHLNGAPYIQSGIRVDYNALKQMAVVHCAQSAQAVTDYLSSILDPKGADVFVINDAGEVLFKSEKHCPNPAAGRNSNGCGNHSGGGGVDGGEEPLKYVEAQVRLKELVKEDIHYANVEVGGLRYLIDSWHHSFQGIELAVVIMTPHRSLWRSMDVRTRFVLVAIPLLALLLGAFVWRLIYLLRESVASEANLRAEILQLINAKRRAEASRDAKTAFLSHMSHELRTPMACIIGLLENLLGDLKLSEHESSVKQVHRCATSLVGLLNSVLDIAKVEAGKLELEKAEFDLEAELSSLIDVFSVQCDNKGLHLSLQLSDEIPKIVSGDPARFVQIFTNLIGNGIKFTSAGRVVVRGWVDEGAESDESGTLGTNSESSGGKNEVVMMFEVDDTGVGIDKALRERVFENFVQGHVSTPRTHGGSGLGLGIVRSLVHLMGGTIRIEEKAGNGTLFQFSLCFDLAPDQRERESDLVKVRHVVLGMPEKDCRDIVSLWLEDRGLSVHRTRSWEEVLIHMKALPLSMCGRRIEASSDCVDSLLQSSAGQGGTSSWQNAGGSNSGSGAGFGLGGRSGFIRRSKSDGTADVKGEKPVIVVDVDLLPPFSNELEYMQTFEKLGFHMKTGPGAPKFPFLDFEALVWITASNTPAAFKRVLKLVNRSILVRRPLHASRLRDLFRQLEGREHFGPANHGGGGVPAAMYMNSGGAAPKQPSPLSVKIVKQMGGAFYAAAADSSPGVDGGILIGESTSVMSSKFPIGSVREDSLGLESEKSIPESEKVDPSPALSSYQQELELPEQEQGQHQRRHQQQQQQRRSSGSLARSKSDNVAKLLPWSKPAAKALEKLEILVAEDHSLLRRLATSMLRKLGAVISCEAVDGQEAFNLVVARFESGQPPFHCILMDCQMPVMDGYDACSAIRNFEREKKQHTRIIALTANAMATDMEKCFRVGMDAFISKPIQQDHLIRVILTPTPPAGQGQETTKPLLPSADQEEEKKS